MCPGSTAAVANNKLFIWSAFTVRLECRLLSLFKQEDYLAWRAPRGDMDLAREERVMNRTTDREKRRAVVCLFCGLHTPVPHNRSVNDPRVSIIRCRRCGKEAPYPADKIVDA